MLMFGKIIAALPPAPTGQTTVNNCAPKHYITPINVMP